MKKKLFSILFALVLVLSLSLITAVPVAAQTTYNVVPYTLTNLGSGTVAWSDVEAHTGSYSVKLYAPASTGDYGKVVMPLDMEFEDFADFSVWVEGGTTAQALPLHDIKAVVDDVAGVTLPISNKGTGLDVDLQNKIVVLASQPGQSEALSPTLMSDGIDGWEKYGTHSDATINVGGTDEYWSIFVYSASYVYEAAYDYYTWDEIHSVLDGKATVTEVRIELRYPQDPADVASTVYVDDPTIHGTTYYGKIQDAIDAASPGDVISVAEGTYEENLVVDVEGLTIESSGAVASTIIDAADASDYVVEITADSVTLDGFTITGIANSNENMAAVILQGVDSCTITNNILTDNYKDAINLYSTGGNYSDSNTVSNNVINGPDGVGDTFGIKIKGSHNTISGNEVYNTDTPIHIWSWSDTETASPDYNTISGNTIAQGSGTAAYKYGINIKTGQHNVVTGNTITGAERAAIYLYTSDRMEAEEDFDPRPASDNISGNIIAGGEVGIALLEGANTNTISGNNITGTTVAGILCSLSRWPEDFTASPSSYLVGAPESYLQISGNTISGNTLSNCGHGIAMEYADNNTLTTNTIENNTSVADIDWHGVGFTADAAGVYFDANSSGNVVNYNNIDGNTGYGLKNENSSVTLDATNNWWGHSSGPSHSPGSGDKVSGDVSYDPWLLEPVVPGAPPPTTFDTTQVLNVGWTLVSTDNWIDPAATVGANVTIAYNYTPSLGYLEVTPAALVPVDALYLKTDDGGGLGITYSGGVPVVSSKDLEAGWNLISSATETDARAILSPLRYIDVGEEQGVGLATLVSQGSYNRNTGDFYLATMVSYDWTVLMSETLNPFDGYWVYMNDGKNFGVIPQ